MFEGASFFDMGYKDDSCIDDKDEEEKLDDEDELMSCMGDELSLRRP